MARAFGVGIETSPCCEDAVPIGVVELGTASSQPSSCFESCWLLSVYQEPACEDLRVTILDVIRRREYKRLKSGMLDVVFVSGGMIPWVPRGVASTGWWGKSYLYRVSYAHRHTWHRLRLLFTLRVAMDVQSLRSTRSGSQGRALISTRFSHRVITARRCTVSNSRCTTGIPSG